MIWSAASEAMCRRDWLACYPGEAPPGYADACRKLMRDYADRPMPVAEDHRLPREPGSDDE